MVRISVLRPADWERSRAVRLRALADAPDAFWSTLEQEEHLPADAWRARLERQDALTFVAADDGVAAGEDVGVAVLLVRDDVGSLVSVWVDPRARGRGVAETLVRAVVDEAARRGLRRVLLDVGDHNVRAVRFYERLGFRPTGRTSAFPPPRDHITEHERALDVVPTRP